MSHSRSKVVVCVHVPIHCSCVLKVKWTFRAEQRKLHRMGFKPVHSGTPVWHPTSGAAQLVASFPGLSGGRRETPGDPGLMHEIKFSVYGECARKDFADTHVYDASMSSVCFATTNNSTLWPRVPTLTAPMPTRLCLIHYSWYSVGPPSKGRNGYYNSTFLSRNSFSPQLIVMRKGKSW